MLRLKTNSLKNERTTYGTSYSLKRKQTSGFTIVELLIVIIVIGILATLTILAYSGVTNRAQVATLQSDLSGAANQLGIDNATNGTYPATAAAANNGAGLKASPGTTWQYTYTSGTNSYCLTGTNSGVSYYVSDTNNVPHAGACPGDVNGGGGGGAQPDDCPSGFIPIPANTALDPADPAGFCVMKYEAKQVGSSSVPISQASGTPWVSISQTTAIADAPNVAGCAGCHLITDAEWVTVAANVLSVASNWSGGSVGSGYIYSGHNDSAPANSLAADASDANGYAGETNTGGNQRRTLTLTNGQVIWDLAGNVWEWTSGTIAGGQQPGFSGESAYAYKEYNNGSMLWNGLPSIDRPATIYPGAGSWSSAQGIGQMSSNYGETVLHGYYRGGYWINGSNAGVLALNLTGLPSGSAAYIGFRVAR